VDKGSRIPDPDSSKFNNTDIAGRTEVEKQIERQSVHEAGIEQEFLQTTESFDLEGTVQIPV